MTTKGITKPLADRLAARVKKTDTCWLWQGYIDRNGYGQICSGPRPNTMLYTHRVAAQLAGIEIPPGMSVDHTCEVKHCVNPMHLQVVSLRENTDRYWHRARGKRGEQQ